MFTKFLKDRRGSIAPMMAILAVPLIGGAGVAIDYSQANATKASFQAALSGMSGASIS